MTSEEIARKLCEHNYKHLCTHWKKEADGGYMLEEYWEKNKAHFIKQAKIYLEVRACLKTKE